MCETVRSSERFVESARQKRAREGRTERTVRSVRPGNSEQRQAAQWFACISEERGRGDGRERILEVILSPGATRAALFLEGLEQVVQRAFVGDGAHDQVRMRGFWIAEGVGGREGGVGHLHGEMRGR